MVETSNITLATLPEKNIVVLGAGLTGLSCLRFFQQHNISCAVNDNRENAIDVTTFTAEFANTPIVLGYWDHQLLANADIVVASPGIDVDAQGIKNMLSEQCQLIGDVELFCQLNRQLNNIPTLAVTGSNGKSTVVTLLAHLGERLGYNVALGGNIGVPVLQQIDQKLDCLILELSSFQLETLISMQAQASSVLNISDDHLDRHHSIENYQTIKQRIYEQAQVNVFNRDDALTIPQKSHSTASNVEAVISFGSDAPAQGHFGLKLIDGDLTLMYGEQSLIAAKLLPIAGIHNALNCLAVFALGKQAGWSLTDMVTHVTSFSGLAHRCQRVNNINDVVWINDSKATNVGAALAALEGLLPTISADNQLVMIAGGDGKGADFSPLAAMFKQTNIELITLGKDAPALATLFNNSQSETANFDFSGEPKKAFQVSTMREAVAMANQLASNGDIVLLSPACASIDMFKNYMARGDKFVEAVKGISLETNGDRNKELSL